MESDVEGNLWRTCEKIVNVYKVEAVREAFTTILLLLNNILKKPKEQNVRMFKKTNNTIKTKILVIKECAQVMKDIGYVDLDSEFMVFQNEDVTNIKTAVKVLNDQLEFLKKKVAEEEELKELKRLEEVKRQNEEIQKKFREERMRKMEIQKQIDNDKREKAQMEKPTDSVSKNLEFGAKVCKFEPQKGKRG